MIQAVSDLQERIYLHTAFLMRYMSLFTFRAFFPLSVSASPRSQDNDLQ